MFFSIALFFVIFIIFTAKLPYNQLVMWQKYLQQKCLWQDVYNKDVIVLEACEKVHQPVGSLSLLCHPTSTPVKK